MTSVRKAVKNCKKRRKRHIGSVANNRLALKAILELFEKGTSSNLEYTNVGVIRSLAKVKSSNTRLERKKKKQGKWKEWCKFRAHMKRQQASTLPPCMLGLDFMPHNFEFEKYLTTSKNE